MRYLQQIAPFEEDFDVEKDELVDVLLLSGNAGGPEDERALNDFDLSFLDEGLPPDDDVFKFTDDNGQFDKGPIPVNEVSGSCTSTHGPKSGLLCNLCTLCSMQLPRSIPY